MKPHSILLTGLTMMLLAVAIGAFGAHALKAIILPELLPVWKTASQYHYYHALGLTALGLWAQQHASAKLTTTVAYCFIFGILLFSGSLYVLAVSGLRWLGMITPVGGVLFLAGWSSWVVAVIKHTRTAAAATED